MPPVLALVLLANPQNTVRLQLDEEVRTIEEKIRASEYRDSLKLVTKQAARADDLIQVLNEIKPSIVHFSGHGTDSGEIILTDNYGDPKPISSRAITQLFRIFKDKVRVVILNACYSSIQARAITEVIDCAIGINSDIGDKASITFTSSFYRAIAFGLSINMAFEQGKLALLMERGVNTTLPELLTKHNVDPSKIILVRRGVAKESSTMPSYQPSGHLANEQEAKNKELRRKFNSLITKYQSLTTEIYQERNPKVRKQLEQSVAQLKIEIQLLEDQIRALRL